MTFSTRASSSTLTAAVPSPVREGGSYPPPSRTGGGAGGRGLSRNRSSSECHRLHRGRQGGPLSRRPGFLQLVRAHHQRPGAERRLRRQQPPAAPAWRPTRRADRGRRPSRRCRPNRRPDDRGSGRAAERRPPSRRPGCAQPRSSPRSPRRAQINVIQQLPITTLDANMEQALANLNPAIHMTDPLVFRDPNGNVKPLLATDWSYPRRQDAALQDPQGIKFHNGDVMTTDDIVFTYKRILDLEVRLPAPRSGVSATSRPLIRDGRLPVEAADATLLGRLSIPAVPPRSTSTRSGTDAFGRRRSGPGREVRRVGQGAARGDGGEPRTTGRVRRRSRRSPIARSRRTTPASPSC